MKNTVLFIVIMLPFLGVCQLKIVNESITSKDSAVVYIGIKNILKVEGAQDISKWKVTATSAEISIVNNTIMLEESRVGYDTLRIYNNKKLLSTNVFRVDKINNPVALLAYTFDTVISLNRILANPYLTVKIPGSLYDFQAGVISFQCSLMKAQSNRYLFTDFISGNKLTSDMLSNIRKLFPGDKIIFDEIHAVSSGGDTRKLPRVTITIK